MKTLSAKVLAATCCIGLSGLATAATVTPDRILDFSKQGTYSVTTKDARFVDYQVLLASGQDRLNIDLLSTQNTFWNSELAGYALWEDSNPALNEIQISNLFRPVHLDVIGLAGLISWAVDSSKQYVLRIDPAGGAGAVATSSVSAVPLPGALWLFGSALLGFLGLSNRRKF